LNVAVSPGIEVTIDEIEGPDQVILELEAFGSRYPMVPGRPRSSRGALVEAAIDAFAPPKGRAVMIRVASPVPSGCGTGTSAAVAVALIGGLASLRAERPSLNEVAYAAHRLEVVTLGLESGIQDQLCSVHGGISFIEIDRYPQATIETLPMWEQPSELLTLVICGSSHDSSSVHQQVIAESGGSKVFSRLRAAAVAAHTAVVARDLTAFGLAMVANTDAQRALHRGIIGVDAQRLMDAAAAEGAIGWKVNGAGGTGGSVKFLSPSRAVKKAVEDSVNSSDRNERVIPVQIATSGLQVTGAV
jgi:D-glycero-alpha-D-manno-heptose-7-phosphate kinase